MPRSTSSPPSARKPSQVRHAAHVKERRMRLIEQRAQVSWRTSFLRLLLFSAGLYSVAADQSTETVLGREVSLATPPNNAVADGLGVSPLAAVSAQVGVPIPSVQKGGGDFPTLHPSVSTDVAVGNTFQDLEQRLKRLTGQARDQLVREDGYITDASIRSILETVNESDEHRQQFYQQIKRAQDRKYYTEFVKLLSDKVMARIKNNQSIQYFFAVIDVNAVIVTHVYKHPSGQPITLTLLMHAVNCAADKVVDELLVHENLQFGPALKLAQKKQHLVMEKKLYQAWRQKFETFLKLRGAPQQVTEERVQSDLRQLGKLEQSLQENASRLPAQELDQLIPLLQYMQLQAVFLKTSYPLSYQYIEQCWSRLHLALQERQHADVYWLSTMLNLQHPLSGFQSPLIQACQNVDIYSVIRMLETDRKLQAGKLYAVCVLIKQWNKQSVNKAELFHLFKVLINHLGNHDKVYPLPLVNVRGYPHSLVYYVLKTLGYKDGYLFATFLLAKGEPLTSSDRIWLKENQNNSDTMVEKKLLNHAVPGRDDHIITLLQHRVKAWKHGQTSLEKRLQDLDRLVARGADQALIAERMYDSEIQQYLIVRGEQLSLQEKPRHTVQYIFSLVKRLQKMLTRGVLTDELDGVVRQIGVNAVVFHSGRDQARKMPMSALMYAFHYGYTQAAERLAAFPGADSHQAFYAAMLGGHLSAIDLALKLPGIVVDKNAAILPNGQSPLLKAVEHRNVDVIMLLLKHGADFPEIETHEAERHGLMMPSVMLFRIAFDQDRGDLLKVMIGRGWASALEYSALERFAAAGKKRCYKAMRVVATEQGGNPPKYKVIKAKKKQKVPSGLISEKPQDSLVRNVIDFIVTFIATIVLFCVYMGWGVGRSSRKQLQPAKSKAVDEVSTMETEAGEFATQLNALLVGLKAENSVLKEVSWQADVVPYRNKNQYKFALVLPSLEVSCRGQKAAAENVLLQMKIILQGRFFYFNEAGIKVSKSEIILYGLKLPVISAEELRLSSEALLDKVVAIIKTQEQAAETERNRRVKAEDSHAGGGTLTVTTGKQPKKTSQFSTNSIIDEKQRNQRLRDEAVRKNLTERAEKSAKRAAIEREHELRRQVIRARQLAAGAETAEACAENVLGDEDLSDGSNGEFSAGATLSV